MTDGQSTAETERRSAYECTDFEIVPQGNLELPVSTSAAYEADVDIDPGKLQNALSGTGYVFIAPYREGKRLSSKVYDSETNEFFHIKVGGSVVRIYPKDENFSFETFSRAVDAIGDVVGGLSHAPERYEDTDTDRPNQNGNGGGR